MVVKARPATAQPLGLDERPRTWHGRRPLRKRANGPLNSRAHAQLAMKAFGVTNRRRLVILSILMLTGAASSACGGRSAEKTRHSSGGAGGTEGAAGADATPGGQLACPPDLPSQAELAATPRKDENLELLALKLSPGKIIANQATYERVIRDVGAIRNQQPQLKGIGFFPAEDGRTIALTVSAGTLAQMQRGEYHPWDCLNATYHAKEPFTHSSQGSTASVTLELRGIYATTLLAADYERLPDVVSATRGVGGGDGPTICVTPTSNTWHYVFDAASGDCPGGCIDHAYSYFTTELSGDVKAIDTWATQANAPAPTWVATYASRSVCR